MHVSFESHADSTVLVHEVLGDVGNGQGTALSAPVMPAHWVGSCCHVVSSGHWGRGPVWFRSVRRQDWLALSHDLWRHGEDESADIWEVSNPLEGA